MPTDLEPGPRDPAAILAARIKALEARIALLERGVPIPIGTGTPAANEGRDGSLAGARTSNRLWLKIDGTWRFTALT